MNGICRTLDCFFGPLFNPGDDTWMAVKVRRDGNMHEIGGPFATEQEAEDHASYVHDQELQDNGQFGVGA